jgi:hypothetical protein
MRPAVLPTQVEAHQVAQVAVHPVARAAAQRVALVAAHPAAVAEPHDTSSLKRTSESANAVTADSDVLFFGCQYTVYMLFRNRRVVPYLAGTI